MSTDFSFENRHGQSMERPNGTPSLSMMRSELMPHMPPSVTGPGADDASPQSPAAGGDPAKPMSSRPLNDTQGRTLHPRSCVTCRKRKVKCDRVHPCTNCNRAHIECVFPAPGRAPRKKKAVDGRDKELLDRLRRLEGVVKGLGVEVSPDGHFSREDLQHVAAQQKQEPKPGPNTTRPTELLTMDCVRQDPSKPDDNQTHWLEDTKKGGLENRFGRLVVNNQGRSRYVNNSFWANLSNEVEDLKGILNQSSDEEEDHAGVSPESSTIGGAPQAWMFGYSSQTVDMVSLSPLPSQIAQYWEVYKDRVDPLVKVLHIPTIEPIILQASGRLNELPKALECLLFAIYYAVTTSLSPEDCIAKLGEEKRVLLSRYRFGVEQALARANFLITEEMMVLQAFVVFLLCLRRNSDARVIWTLTGLVVRIAQTIGIHRDGSHFNLSPFDIEMRRRLFWHVCILDTRASEDHGCDPTIVESSFDTKLPLNVNDADLSPDMKEFPPEKTGCTDVTFCLVRFECSNTFRRLNYVPPGTACRKLYEQVTLQEKEKWITECHKRLEERYLRDCDMSVPIFWVTATVARLMMSKMWLMVYAPFQREDGGKSLGVDIREKLFITSLENIEYSVLLETEARTMKWGWLFRTYIQWHALAFLLSELCRRTTGELCERAWVAVDKVLLGQWSNGDVTGAGHLWRPLKKVYRKAREARRSVLMQEAARSGKGPPMPERRYSPNANPMFDNAPKHHPLVRAPLSHAQLTRFSRGPSFGQIPLDKHEIMRSPNTTNGTPVQIDLAAAPVAMIPEDKLEFEQGAEEVPPLQFAAIHQAAGAQGYPFGFPTEFAGGADSPTNNSFSNMNEGGFALRNDSVDSQGGLEGNDVSIMDTSGDLNWENWDQLVRQFAMDTDGNDLNNAPINLNGADWNMGNTNGTNPGMRGMNNTGMGMGGGDWF